MKRISFLLALVVSLNAFTQNSYQFLGKYTSDGTPLYLAENDTVSKETLDLVDNSLPERYPVPTYNPQYISSGYDTDVILDSEAEVCVTFIKEGAGYKNVLGFYTYDLKNPPKKAPKAKDITIIFPNVSAKGSGGSLEAGNKVKIGTFPAGTGIGWVLLANGWQNGAVTDGLWRLFSNTEFNPEKDSILRQHNVLLNDPTNERIILGFEDIRRDYSSCDNDFNDAIFYITANPFSALRTNNTADVSSATNVSSGNNGGLESNGNLAALIAQRNLNRIKTNNFANTKAKQTVFNPSTASNSRKKSNLDLQQFLPTTGMFGTETTYTSSPNDLIDITNAKEVYSVDYYQGSERVAVVLATKTTDGVYSHSKAICDRLNNSTLEDIRTVQFKGYEIIMVKLKRADGAIEFALNFSIQQLGTENKLHSYWNIDQYPYGNYANFQVWGSSMGQVSSITDYILRQFKTLAPLTENRIANRIPAVFVKSGYYKNGQLNLKLTNRAGVSNIMFKANKKATELSTVETITENIQLSSAFEQDVVIPTGGLFDISFAIEENGAEVNDILYLADGPWGLDYVESETFIGEFEIKNNTHSVNPDEYSIERDIAVAGQVYGTVNVFRNLLPGELSFDASAYSSVSFSIQNSLPVEVILVTENTTNWENRLRFQIPANTSLTNVTIRLEDFTNTLNQKFENEKIKGFVFSIGGDYTSFQPFDIAIANLKLGNGSALSTTVSDVTKTLHTVDNYPNPFTNATTIILPEHITTAQVKLIDITGKTVQREMYNVGMTNKIEFTTNNPKKGVYLLSIETNDKLYQTKCSIQ